jgi:hypothetical protein
MSTTDFQKGIPNSSRKLLLKSTGGVQKVRLQGQLQVHYGQYSCDGSTIVC